MSQAEFHCRSEVCDGRIFVSDANTVRCIHCRSSAIRRADRPRIKAIIGASIFLAFLAGLAWCFVALDDSGREKFRSVQFMGCADTLACNYSSTALIASEVECTFASQERNCDGECWDDDDGDGICNAEEVLGCTDPVACNYNVNATDEDDSCGYPQPGYTCTGHCVEDEDGDGVCDADEVFGCTDPRACNFEATATESDESCWYRDPGKRCEESAGALMFTVNCDVDEDGILEDVQVSFMDLSSDDFLGFEFRTKPSSENAAAATLSQVYLRLAESESQGVYGPCDGISNSLLEPFCEEGVWFLAVDPKDSSLNIVLRSSSANGRGGKISVYRIRIKDNGSFCTREMHAEAELGISGNVYQALTIYDYEKGSMEAVVTTGNVHEDADLVDMITGNDQWSREYLPLDASTALAVEGILNR